MVSDKGGWCYSGGAEAGLLSAIYSRETYIVDHFLSCGERYTPATSQMVTFPGPVRPGAQNAPPSTDRYSSPSSWIVATKDVLESQDEVLEMLLIGFMVKRRFK